MGLFSKIFGKEIEKEAKKIFSNIAGNNGAKPQSTQAQAQNAGTNDFRQPQQSAPSYSPSGESWGETMPAEENQFSFGGTYDQYFEKVFREEFPGYEIVKAKSDYMPAYVFSFFKGDSKVLVVEVISQRSEPQKLRKNCKANNIPYLRYYYDYDGWWNTRSYVVKRTRNALGGN